MLNFCFHILLTADKNLVVSHLELHLHDIKCVTSVITILLFNKLYKTTVKYLTVAWFINVFTKAFDRPLHSAKRVQFIQTSLSYLISLKSSPYLHHVDQLTCSLHFCG